MEASNRIIVNTIAQYVRTIINMVLSLYSSRLVLDILGVDDYGVYSLVAGVVSMLSFLTNSLVGSTQRYLSVSQGKGDIQHLKEVFNNSLVIHILLGLATSVVLFGLTPFIFDGFLNIPADRIETAKGLYALVVVMVCISFIASPYRALLVSHENIVYTSVVDVLDGVLKVILVLLLPHIPFDKLLAYGIITLSIQLFNLLMFSVYSHIKYEECMFPRIRQLSWSFVKELSAFTGWILYSSVCTTARNQGVAIVLNRAFGAVINAAYGIGLQISGMLAFVGTSFNNAIAPQLMAAEGGHDRKKMLQLAEAQSKFSFILMAMFGIPAMFQMKTLLQVWLVEVPENTVMFGCMFLSMQIVDMLSTGLAMANRAIGNIGKYTVVSYTPKLLILPVVWGILKVGLPLVTVAILMFAVEALCMLLRIYMFRNESWFDVKSFVHSVILKNIFPVLVSVLICVLCSLFISNNLACFIVTFVVSVIGYVAASYYTSLNDMEKDVVNSVCRKILTKLSR